MSRVTISAILSSNFKKSHVAHSNLEKCQVVKCILILLYSMAYVDSKNWPCCNVEFTGREPHEPFMDRSDKERTGGGGGGGGLQYQFPCMLYSTASPG